MLEETTSPAGASQLAAGYSYPRDLARFVSERWGGAQHSGEGLVPDAATLEDFFTGCYHATLLREEAQPVTFRAVLAEPALFTPGRAPEGLLRLELGRPLSFQPNELRRLSAAADPSRTLIGVRRDDGGGLRIWGMIHSGTRWLRNVRGGRRAGAPLPPAPVVHAHAPGSIEAYRGYELVGRLQGGVLSGGRADVFESRWLPRQFVGFRDEILARHAAARERARESRGESWAPLEPALPRRIAERLLKRVIAILREAGHGGTIIFIPPEDAAACLEGAFIDIRYPVAGAEARQSFPDLLVDLLNRLARLHGALDRPEPGAVGWRQFELTTDDEIATLDEGLFEVAHLIAGLATADGAVVLTKHHELLGFGGMISGKLPTVRSVARALDLEGERVAEEGTGNVGARHRSAYRMAGALPGAVLVVISQDGGVRFVCQKGGRVTYWEQE